MTRGLFSILALTPALGKIIWSPSDIEERRRRLALNLVSSVNDTSAPDCIIGGYDDANAARIYVGGPCSKFNYSSGTPSDGFRWVVMETHDLEIPMITEDLIAVPNEAVQQSQDLASHAEVGLSSMFKFDDPAMSEAGFFASTTSYLAKENMNVNTNTFVVGEANTGAYDTIDLCIQKCCETVTAQGCKCGTCPNVTMPIVPGDFKYSILAAAVDRAASSTKGWAKVADKYGMSVAGATGVIKEIQGHMMVYQSIDFTNMNADTITVVGPGDNTSTYASMQACNLANMANCTATSVKSMTIAAAGWEGVTYTFPQYFNRGQWYKVNAGLRSTTIDTKPVVIEAIRVDDASLAAYNMQGKKVLLVRYKFDITGIDADNVKGKYMVYDPTVNTVTQAKIKAQAGDPNTPDTGAIAGARTSTGLASLAALMVLLNVLK